jgi:hypothetical protein
MSGCRPLNISSHVRWAAVLYARPANVQDVTELSFHAARGEIVDLLLEEFLNPLAFTTSIASI